MTERIAQISNWDGDENLDRLGVTDEQDRDDLWDEVRLADLVRESTWRDDTLDNDRAVVLGVAEARGLWWAIWADPSMFSAEACTGRADAESRYEAWMVGNDWLDYGPPTTTDVDGVDVMAEGMKSTRDDDGNVVLVPLAPR